MSLQHDDLFKPKAPPVNHDTDNKQSFTVSKALDDSQMVFGWASVAKDAQGNPPLDWEGDQIDPVDLEKAVYDFNLQFRTCNDWHQADSTCGTMVESVMFTKAKMEAMGIPEGIVPSGWWVGFKVQDKEIYEKVKKGTYRMFSIEGSARRVPIE